MPSAPASSAIRAMPVMLGQGTLRRLRSMATALRLAESLVICGTAKESRGP